MDEARYLPSASHFVADHVARYEASAGRNGGAMDTGAPVIILTTVGRRTGAVRKSPLIRVRHRDGYIVIASMGGAPRHPAWYVNLVANPDVMVQDGGEIHRLRARTATGCERSTLWKMATAVWPDYDDYQAGTDREIPVVVLEPS